MFFVAGPGLAGIDEFADLVLVESAPAPVSTTSPWHTLLLCPTGLPQSKNCPSSCQPMMIAAS